MSTVILVKPASLADIEEVDDFINSTPWNVLFQDSAKDMPKCAGRTFGVNYLATSEKLEFKFLNQDNVLKDATVKRLPDNKFKVWAPL